MGAAGMVQAYGGMINTWASVNKMMAARDEADYQEQAAEKNRQIAQGAQSNAYERGQQEQMTSRLKYGNLKGEQAAAYGASGVSVNSGSALKTLADTQAMSDYDAKVIANNAAREAWGYRQKSEQFVEEAKMARRRKDSATLEGVLNIQGSFADALGGAAKSYASSGGRK